MRKNVVGKITLIAICFTFLCAVASCAYFMSVKTVAYAFSGDVTDLSQYDISSADDLVELAENVNNGLYDGYYGVTFVMTSDISLADCCMTIDGENGWIPIGSFAYPFKGTFDGAGYSITGLTVNRENAERVGLFGEINTNATVKNLTVSGSITGSNYTAGIVGYNQGTIENCTNRASISAKNNSMHVGGIVGYNEGTVSASNNEIDIDLGFVTMVGGIVGCNTGTVEKSYNRAGIMSTNPMIGGIVGNNSAGGNINICLNAGEISGKSIIGGIAGNNQGVILNVFNSGYIVSDMGTAGGILGSSESTGVLSHALSVSDVNGTEDTAAVCGYNLGMTTNCFYDNSVYFGTAVNGIPAEDSFGLSTRMAVHDDVLINADKLGLLIAGNADMWVKREENSNYCYYPELKYFHDNVPAVSDVSHVERTTVSTDDISLSETTFVYDGQSHEADIYLGEILLENNRDYTAAYLNNVNAGTAEVTITFINGYRGTVVKELIITQAELTVAWDRTEFIYNGTKQAPILNITGGLVEGDDVTFEYDTSSTPVVGTYDITATLADTVTNANYYLSSTTTKFAIKKAEITVVWSNETFTYNGDVQVPTASVATGQVGTENITFRYEYSSNVDAGTHTIDAYLADTEINTNYAFAGETHYYDIEKRPITVIWSEISLYYNGIAQFPTAEVATGRVGEDDITFVYSGYEQNINANEQNGYTVLIQLADNAINANYVFQTESHSYSIYRAEIKIAWWDIPLTYTGLAQYPSFYIESGRIGEQDITFVISDYSQNIAASGNGHYQIEVMLGDTEVDLNYVLPYTAKTYDIAKADFNPRNTVEFRTQTFAFDGAPKSLSIVGDLPIGVTVKYENNSHVEIGEYVVNAVFYVDTNNYNPLETDRMSATVFIANMAFTDTSSGIIVTNKDVPDYSLSLSISKTEDFEFKEFGKKALFAYAVKFNAGVSEFSVPLTETQLKSTGIKVVYKNSAGEIIGAEYAVTDGKLVFTAEGLTEFMVLADINLLPMWLGIGGAIIVIVGVVLFAVIRKKRRLTVQYHASAAVNESNGFESCNIRTEGIEAPGESGNGGQNSGNNKTDIDAVPNDMPFTFDGVYCLSYDWFIKSLRFKTIEKQKAVCSGDGNALLLTEAIPQNAVYWLGKRYKIKSSAYKRLIDRAKETVK